MTVYSEQLLALPDSVRPIERTAARRFVFFDVCRFIAAMGIVWVHTIGDDTWGRVISIGRIFNAFWAAAAVFMVFDLVARDPDRSYSAYVKGRFARLYLPFLAWTGIYLAFHLIKGAIVGVDREPHGYASLLWCGSSPHLYFLPFIFMVCALAFPLARWALRSEQNALAAAGIGLVAAAIWALGMDKPEHLISRDFRIGRYDYWMVNVWDIMPAVGLGVVLAVAYRLLPDALTRATRTANVGLAIAALGVASIWISGLTVAAKCIGGAGYLVFAMAPWRGVWIDPLANLGRLSFGIYLSHNLFAACWRMIAARQGMLDEPLARLAGFAFSMAAAIAVTVLLDRHPKTRWLIGRS